MSTLFVGLDVGSTTFHQVLMQPDGVTKATRSFPMSEANLIKAFTGLGGNAHVHLEAGELAPWVRGVIAPLVRRVVISHPPANAWIGKDPNKRDQLDAAKLADLLRMNRFTEVYYAEEQSRREFKQLVQHFDDLTDQQIRLKYKIKARFRAQGVIVRGQRLFTAKGRGAVLDRVASRQVRTAIEQLYEVLDQTLASQLAAQRLMLQAARAFPEIELFKAVPGIGPLSACRRERLRPDSAPLQQRAQALALLPARRQPPHERRQAAESPTAGPGRVRAAQGCDAQSLRRRLTAQGRQPLQACLRAVAREHIQQDARASFGAAQDRLGAAGDVASHDAVSRRIGLNGVPLI